MPEPTAPSLHGTGLPPATPVAAPTASIAPVAPQPPAPRVMVSPVPRPGLRRPTQGRALAGVAAGLAEHLGLPVRAIRIAFVVASVATGGAGVVAYVLLWALTPQESVEPVLPPRPGRVSSRPAPPVANPQSVAWQRFSLSRDRIFALVLGVALLCVSTGILLARRGVNLHGEIWLPVLVLLIGAGVALRQLDVSERTRWLAPAGAGTRVGLLRLLGGVVLAVVGILLLVARGTSARELIPVAVASLAVLLGVGLVLAPWGLRLWRDLERERALRVRELERAEIAAHLHDSVLQTLALIQRAPGNAAEVARLARAQERELRDYLYAGAPPAPRRCRSPCARWWPRSRTPTRCRSTW